jgi:hypothetical protein
MYENFAMNSHEGAMSSQSYSAWVGSISLPETKIFLAGLYNKHLQGGESEIGRTEGGWKFPELTERSVVGWGNFQPSEVRPIPDSPNLQVCLVFIERVTYRLSHESRWVSQRSSHELSRVMSVSDRLELSQVKSAATLESSWVTCLSRVMSIARRDLSQGISIPRHL